MDGGKYENEQRTFSFFFLFLFSFHSLKPLKLIWMYQKGNFHREKIGKSGFAPS